MTSVKEFRVDTPATADSLGRGAFVFTDDYSIFDWGKMPDTIPNKGASLCAMGAANFERLEDAGVPTHYRGVQSGSEVVATDEVIDPPREMAIDLTRTPDLPYESGSYDYAAFHEAAGENYLIPLEIVFRNTVPIGSSLRSRGNPVDFGLNYDEWPDEPIDLEEPLVEFSTKFEESDRYLTEDNASYVAGEADLDELEAIAHQVNEILTERAAEVGMKHEDGKIECLYYDGEIRVADVVGTFDENRFSYDGQQLSKEVIRQYHIRTQPAWVEAVDEAKVQAKDDPEVADWRQLCEIEPEPLPGHVVDSVREMYTSGANAYLGWELFAAPPLDEAVEAIRSLS